MVLLIKLMPDPSYISVTARETGPACADVTSFSQRLRRFGAVPLRRAAEFSAALQYRVDPAGSDRAACRRHAVVRADALGPVAVVGRGAKGVSVGRESKSLARHQRNQSLSAILSRN